MALIEIDGLFKIVIFNSHVKLPEGNPLVI